MAKRWLPIAAAGLLAISLSIFALITDGEKANGIQMKDERLPLMEMLNQELAKLEKPAGNMRQFIESVISGYDDLNGPLDFIETDLDQDGSHELITVLTEAVRDQQSGELLQRNAYGAVLSYAEGKFSIESFTLPVSSFGWAKVEAVEDLTGDGKPEVVWVSFDVGAHTAHSTYTVSSWSEGNLVTFEGTAEIDNVSKAEIMDGNLVLTGGMIGSAGAGPWQREFTDYYSVVNHTIQHTDRVFESSPTPYHRLIDGLWAEAHGRMDRALSDFTEAIAMEFPSYKDYFFIFEGEWVQGDAMPAEEAEFDRIVKQFSLLRRAFLMETLQGNLPKNACDSAKTISGYEEEWMTYLNAPAGYANPVWDSDNICSGIEELFR